MQRAALRETHETVHFFPWISEDSSCVTLSTCKWAPGSNTVPSTNFDPFVYASFSVAFAFQGKDKPMKNVALLTNANNKLCSLQIVWICERQYRYTVLPSTLYIYTRQVVVYMAWIGKESSGVTFFKLNGRTSFELESLNCRLTLNSVKRMVSVA